MLMRALTLERRSQRSETLCRVLVVYAFANLCAVGLVGLGIIRAPLPVLWLFAAIAPSVGLVTIVGIQALKQAFHWSVFGLTLLGLAFVASANAFVLLAAYAML